MAEQYVPVSAIEAMMRGWSGGTGHSKSNRWHNHTELDRLVRDHAMTVECPSDSEGVRCVRVVGHDGMHENGGIEWADTREGR